MGKTMVLIGPDEPQFWGHFSTSPEYEDGTPDPLDRWSKRVLDDVSDQFDAEALYPFGGPPFHPFYTWALETGRFWASPIQFLVHDTVGLFVSFRGAILLPQPFGADQPRTSPCQSCDAKPCMTACPVHAFADGYDVDACKGHLTSLAGAPCMSNGCAARRACPIGQGNRPPAQAAFHMESFL